MGVSPAEVVLQFHSDTVCIIATAGVLLVGFSLAPLGEVIRGVIAPDVDAFITLVGKACSQVGITFAIACVGLIYSIRAIKHKLLVALETQD